MPAAANAVRAMELRAQRLPWRTIAAQCGYASEGAAYTAVQRELGRVVAENVVALRREELLALDDLNQRAMSILEHNKTDPDVQLRAINSLTRISEARRRLLGLDLQKDEPVAVMQVAVRYVNDWRPGMPDDTSTEAAPASGDDAPAVWPVVDAAPMSELSEPQQDAACIPELSEFSDTQKDALAMPAFSEAVTPALDIIPPTPAATDAPPQPATRDLLAQMGITHTTPSALAQIERHIG